MIGRIPVDELGGALEFEVDLGLEVFDLVFKVSDVVNYGVRKVLEFGLGIKLTLLPCLSSQH